MNSVLESDLAALQHSAHGFAEQLLRRTSGGDEGYIHSHVDRDGWREMVALGWPALLLPSGFGGFGLPLRYLAAVVSVFARHGASHPLTIVGAEVPALLLGAGSESQAHRFLSEITEQGRLLVSALWDPGYPFEPSCLETVWRPDGDGYALDGIKSPVPYATLADGFVVLARQPESGELALFVVPAEALGVEVCHLPTTTNGPTGEVRLSGVRVPATDRLNSGGVLGAVHHATDVGAAITSAELTVAALRGLELTVEYVRVRRQFDQEIGAFQAVHHHCADMYRDVEAMRIVSAPPLKRRITDSLSHVDISIAKAQTSIKGRQVLEMAHQLHGGVAFYVDYPLELIYRRSLVLQGEYGSSRWHRARLTRELQSDHHAIQGRHHAI